MRNKEKKHSGYAFIPGFIRKDFVRKLIALLLSGIIYVAVMDRLNVSYEVPGVRVPLTPPSGFVLLEKGSPAVKLTVTGSQSRLKSLKPEDFSISDLEIKRENYQEGKPYILQLSPSNFHAPLGVSVVSVSPQSLQIDIDKLESKELKVKANYNERSIPKGYKVKRYSVTPERVRVTAPSMILKTLDEIKTSPIDLSMMTQDFDDNKGIEIPRNDIKVSPQEVMVRMYIEQKFEEKTFSDLKIHVMQNSGKEIVYPQVQYADVTVQAPVETIGKLTMKDFRVYVITDNLPKQGKARLKLEANIINHPGVIVKKIVPETVEVTIK